jgi:hypothetical protein
MKKLLCNEDSCNECYIRFKCYTDREPKITELESCRILGQKITL